MWAVRSPPMSLAGEEPVLAAQDQLAQLALDAVVRQGDVAVLEEQDQAFPLAVQVAEGRAQRRPRWYRGPLLAEPQAEIVDNRRAVLAPPR
jgi:hypothetical protein